MPRRKEDGSQTDGATFNISGGTHTFNLTVADVPRGLVVSKAPRSVEKPRLPKGVTENKKDLKIEPKDYPVLRVLFNQTFLRETTGVGDAEYAMEFEEKVSTSMYTGGRVGEAEYLATIQGIKHRSKNIGPKDIARAIVKRDTRFSGLNEKNNQFLYALNVISTEIEKYWEPPRKSSNSRKK